MSKTLIIMAAGMGSRFGGDKQIAGVGPSGEILLEYSIYDAIQSGFGKIIIIIKSGLEEKLTPLLERMKKACPDTEFHFAYQDASKPFDGISISKNRTKPLGTVHAVLSARDLIDDSFGVINADDYYGRGAYAALSAAMDSFNSDINAVLITYSLCNTLSKYGSVTRGVCIVEDGLLKGIREAYKIMPSDNGEIIETTDSGTLALAENTPVSMNMWGFNKSTLPIMEEYLREFLRNLGEDDNRSECLLPIMAGELINDGSIKVSAFPTDECWFGLTYREDREDASAELIKRHKNGAYPDKLF